jgi:hypothetical protein
MEEAKCINTGGPTRAKGRPNRARIGLGRSAQSGQPGPPHGQFGPLFLEREVPSTLRTWRHCHSQRERELFTREADHKLDREKRREIVREKDHSTRRKHPQVEEKEDTVGSVTMINGAMPSTMMG